MKKDVPRIQFSIVVTDITQPREKACLFRYEGISTPTEIKGLMDLLEKYLQEREETAKR